MEREKGALDSTWTLTNERWQAILHNDATYDDQFIYAVKTTGIFCKPSCKSKDPKKENVRIFQNAQHALSAHFRPCKRCKPTGQRLPDYDWVEQITHFIEMNYQEKLTLDTLADTCHGSPYHLHRTFKRIKGMTPVQYIQQWRINKAITALLESEDSITAIASSVGIPNTPYFITLFRKMTGKTPVEFRISNRKRDPVETTDLLQASKDPSP